MKMNVTEYVKSFAPKPEKKLSWRLALPVPLPLLLERAAARLLAMTVPQLRLRRELGWREYRRSLTRTRAAIWALSAPGAHVLDLNARGSDLHVIECPIGPEALLINRTARRAAKMRSWPLAGQCAKCGEEMTFVGALVAGHCPGMPAEKAEALYREMVRSGKQVPEAQRLFKNV